MILGFLLAIAFDPYSWTGATSLRWALLAVALPLLCSFASPNNFDLTKLLGIGFIAWAALSLTWSPNQWDAYGTFIQLIIVASAFVYGNRVSSLRSIFTGLAIGVTVSAAILLSPTLQGQLSGSIVSVYPHGLWGNRNMMGEIAVLSALGCLAYGRYWFIPGLLPAIFYYKPEIMSGVPSRGAVGALMAGICVWLWPRSKVLSGLLAAALLIGGTAALGFGNRFGPVYERIEVWQAVLHGVTLRGNGLGSLYTLAPYLTDIFDTTMRRVDHAHNEFIEILFELGVIGAVTYIAIVVLAIRNANNESLTVLVGFLVISCVAFPWHIPANAFVGSLVLGHAVRSRMPLRDEYALCRASIRHWHEARRQNARGHHPEPA